MKLKGLIEKRDSLRKEMRALSEKLTAETRAWTPEEEEKFNALSAQVEALGKTIEAIQSSREADGGEATDGEGGEPTPAEGEERAEKADKKKEALERRAFAAYIRNTLSNPEEQRALTFGNNGAVVPKTIAAEIIKTAYDMSPVFAQIRTYKTKGTVTIPAYGADGNDDITVAFNDEMTELTAQQGKFTGVDLNSFLAGALAKISNSLINNTDIDVVDEIVQVMAEAFARFFEKQILIGTSGKTTGLSTLPASQVVTAASQTTITADDLISLKNKVKQAFRTGGYYVAHQDVITLIEKLKDGNGQYIFNPDARDGFAGRLFGYNVYASDNMPATLAAGVNGIYFVNIKEAGALRIAPDLELAILRERFADSHATGIVGWADFDTKLRRAQAVSVLQMAAEE
jgi:HK97 family phage major capsid protein